MKKLFYAPLMAGMMFGGFASADEHGHKHTEMEEHMETVGDSLKALRKIPKDDYVQGAKLVRKAHEALLKSMTEQASMVKEMKDGVEKEVALADSRRLLGLAYAALCELEVAYLEKDEAKIEAAMIKVKGSKKEGHKKYTDD